MYTNHIVEDMYAFNLVVYLKSYCDTKDVSKKESAFLDLLTDKLFYFLNSACINQAESCLDFKFVQKGLFINPISNKRIFNTNGSRADIIVLIGIIYY